MGVFARHGFHQVAEKINLGKFILERMSANAEIEKYSAAERLRMAFEELGPTFVKLGQVLASRPDLIPEEFAKEFEKLHATVSPLSFDIIKEVLEEQYEQNLDEIFSFIDPVPLGSASIAQVHKARLVTSEEVVIKVQRPGIIPMINEDLSVLYLLADLLETYIEEVRAFNPTEVVNEYFRTLELETNFIVEANNIRRFRENFKTQEDIVIPSVYSKWTTERVIVMDAMPGLPLSNPKAIPDSGSDPDNLIRIGLRAYLKMAFEDGFFHGDLHAGNFFILPEEKVGLIDFGVVGRLNSKTQASIANMLLALAKEDYERLAYEYVDMAPFSEKVNVDIFAKELRELISPYYGLTLKDVNLGKILMKSAGIAGRHNIRVPADLLLFFKSIIAIEGMGRKIDPAFDFLQYSLEFAGELVKIQYGPDRIMGEFTQVIRESKNFINGLPRQLNFFLRKINSPDHAIRIDIKELKGLKKSVQTGSNLLFLSVVMSSLILSSSFIFVHPTNNHIWGMPTMSFIGYSLAGILGLFAFINYIKNP